MIAEAWPPESFDSSWLGAPSPPVVAGAAPPDGVYWIDYVGRDDTSFTVSVGRWESCAQLSDTTMCGEGPYASNAIGQQRPAVGEIAVPFDDTTRVVISGWMCTPAIVEGNGADFGAMLAALTADYERSFREGLSAGIIQQDLMIAARNDPSSGFGGPPPRCDDGYSLVWQHAGGPVLLMQRVADFGTGGPIDPAELLLPTAIEFTDGVTTIYFYAGYFP